MEKRSPHYRLAAVQTQMDCVAKMHLTGKAKLCIRECGMTEEEALAVILGLSGRDFHKSMTTNHDHRIWQDVYLPTSNGMELYVKIQQATQYFIVSFKESLR
jgi:motility quorum-sensing regulator/GCU-specific mRNA interferase toxin